MAREKITITIDPATRAQVDAAAHADGVSRSQYVERVLRHEHYRRLLEKAEAPERSEAEERLTRTVLDWQGGKVS